MDVGTMKELWRIASTLQNDAEFIQEYRNARANTSTVDGARRHIIRQTAKRHGYPHQYNEAANYLNAYFNDQLGLDKPVPFVQENGDPNEFVFRPPFFDFTRASDTVGEYAAYDKATATNTPQPTEKTTMLNIKTITYVNGNDISTLSDDQVFKLIAQAEQEIKQYEAIENKPKKLEKKIQDMKDAIADLIMLVDDTKKNGADSN